MVGVWLDDIYKLPDLHVLVECYRMCNFLRGNENVSVLEGIIIPVTVFSVNIFNYCNIRMTLDAVTTIMSSLPHVTFVKFIPVLTFNMITHVTPNT